jgi:hypothetical protein
MNYSEHNQFPFDGKEMEFTESPLDAHYSGAVEDTQN